MAEALDATRSSYRVRREKALVLSGREIPSGNWFVPPGSNRELLNEAASRLA